MRSGLLAAGLLLGMTLYSKGDSSCGWAPTCLEDLEHLSECQLRELYTGTTFCKPFVGVARGKLIHLSDRFLPNIKVRGSRSVWRGKMACEDGYFSNRWIGDRNWIDSHWVIGPSWIDGKPTQVMEYPAGTKLFWNMHDELREIAPGLYLGPVFERFPCPKFRGWVALQLECCGGKK
jgi:hypothetical protein